MAMRVALWCGMYCSLFVAPASADDLSARLDEIFATAETPPGKNRAAVQERLTALAPAADDDHRVRHAYIVALLHESRHKDALREINLLVKSHPKYVPAQRLRAWLLLVQKKYTEALPVLDVLSRLIPSQESQGAIEAADLETAQFLGTAIGFFEGPGQLFLKEPVRQQYKTRIASRLEGRRREVFNEQIKAVAAAFAEFRDAGEERFASAEKKHTEQLQAIQVKEDQVKAARQKAGTEAEKTAEQLRAEWNRLQTNWSALRNNYLELSAQDVAAREQRSRVSTQLNQLARNTKDSNGKSNSFGQSEYDRYAPGLQNSIANLDNVIARIELKGAQLVQNAQVIEGQLQQIVVAGAEIGEQFAMQEQLMANEAKHLSAREARTKRKEPKGPKLNERAHQFGSYERFSYEAEKQRVLDALAGP